MIGLLETAFLEMLSESFDVPPVPRQIIEMRKMFMAGAVSVFGIAAEEVPNGPRTAAMLEELRAFSATLKKS